MAKTPAEDGAEQDPDLCFKKAFRSGLNLKRGEVEPDRFIDEVEWGMSTGNKSSYEVETMNIIVYKSKSDSKKGTSRVDCTLFT
ncbi:hypothetical protein CR203_14055 [Salipaludibacillus neizhouensis]|uniref:Uncharacterized protein n=1 Tax=Salipaludibacillus neizhouensis TaxID=885475 RepID=A0A3A9K1G9_9BACI|nr:hypothetical protein [Salipaludibacillus neizhouensis]RKL66944.1 hypothetical protein CR203_14055 [Salipaludibacillus neizhouensis]